MLSLALACSDVRPQFVMTAEGQARATAEARTTLIVMNGFTYEQGGLRMNGFYQPTKERRGGTSGVRESERCKHVPGVLAGQMAHQAV